MKPILQYRPQDRGFLIALPGEADADQWAKALRSLPGDLQGRERLTPARCQLFLPDGKLLELHGVPLRWQRAYPWLCSIALRPGDAGASLRFWATALRLLQSLVVRGAVLPQLETAPNPWRARWGVSLTSGADREALKALEAAMPPAAWAFPEDDGWFFTKGLSLGQMEAYEVEDDLAHPMSRQGILGAFLEDGADFLVRFVATNIKAGDDPRLGLIHRLRGHKRDRLPWDERLMVALSHPMNEFPTTGVTERTLGEQLAQWSEGARPQWVRPMLKLETPPVPKKGATATSIGEADRLSEEGWVLRLGLETEAGGQIGVAQLWEPSVEPEILQGRQALLRGLARATPFFAPLQRALAGQKPEDLTLLPREAWDFLTKGAASLQEAGFLVHLPEGMAEFGGARRLRAKVRLGGQSVQAGEHEGLEGKVSAEWSLMLGDDALSVEDFAQMASLKHPLVAWKGKWVALDPETLRQISAVIQASRGSGFEAMTKGEAIAAALTGNARIPGVAESIEVELAGDFAQALADLRVLPDKPITQPATFKGQLRPYQLRGLAWLTGLQRLGLGGILADDMGLGKCLEGSTRIRTLDGLVPIQNLWERPKREVRSDAAGGEWGTLETPIALETFDGRHLRATTIDIVYREWIQAPLARVTLKDGVSILSTLPHRFLTAAGWKEAGALKSGDRVAVAARTAHRPTSGLAAGVSELMAWHLAEGHEREPHHVGRFTNADPAVHARVRALAQAEGVSLQLERPHRGRSTSYLCTNKLKALFAPHGYAWGGLSATKRVPEAVLRADLEAQRAFLQAYFDAEGHVGRTHCEVSTASRQVAESLREMFRNFGIWLRVRQAFKSATNGSRIKRRYFVCTFGGNDIERFAAQFSLLSSPKREALARLRDVTRNSNIEGVPAQGVVAHLIDRGIPLRSVGLRSVYRTQGMGKPLAHRVAEALEARGHADLGRTLRDLASESIHWCEVKSVEPTPFEGWVYDLSVPDTHNYLAEGVVTHNTIQVLALLLHRKQETPKEGGATLLVCPTSLLGNWEREVAKFAPSLPLFVHHGNNRDRLPEKFAPHTLVLTTYGVVRREEDTFAARRWNTLVVDEAQAIKNAGSAQSKAVRKLRAEFRLALTGTPIENRLTELWAIMAAGLPGYLGLESTFKERFALPIEKWRDPDVAQDLKKRIGPFVLRRLKSDRSIIQDLPEKQEMKVYTTLTKEQATLYQVRVEQMEKDLEASTGIERRGKILALLTHLKQICNHPAQFLRQPAPLRGRSGKLDRLTDMLGEVVDSGERALVFTQFREMGDRLQTHLKDALGFQPPFLHGGSSRDQRDAMVRSFQEDPSSPPVMLLSLKAGGVGLNLTAATHVFHFDRWWNPAVEDQATDRTYRIGQTKNVQVHKLVTIGTLEEKIDALLESKRDLADRVVGTGEGWLTELDDDALRRLVALDVDAEVLDEEEGGKVDLAAARKMAVARPEVEEVLE